LLALSISATFTITQRCVTDSCGDGVPLVDALPRGLTVVSVDDNGAGSQCTTSENTVTCGSREFTPTQPYTLTIVANTTECGTSTNTASAGVYSGSATYTVEGCPPTAPNDEGAVQEGGWKEFGYPDQGTCISDVNRRSR
jgi:hypothetical protein